eukprot:5780315-Prorocentrum_lima.AAC.1
MMVVHWEEPAPMNTQGSQQSDVAFMEAINMLPQIAPDRRLIPQDLRLQICSRTSGRPVER